MARQMNIPALDLVEHCILSLDTDDFKNLGNKLSVGNQRLLKSIPKNFREFLSKKHEVSERSKITLLNNKGSQKLLSTEVIRDCYYYRRSVRVKFASQDSHLYCLNFRNCLRVLNKVKGPTEEKFYVDFSWCPYTTYLRELLNTSRIIILTF